MTREEFDAAVGKTVFSDEWTGKRFRYGYRNRPFALAHQPKGFIIGALDQDYRDLERGIRHGWIEYPFQLTDDEVYSFELVDMSAPVVPVVPHEVKRSKFGCRNCLHWGCECECGAWYVPLVVDGVPSCGRYTYYD